MIRRVPSVNHPPEERLTEEGLYKVCTVLSSIIYLFLIFIYLFYESSFKFSIFIY